VSSWPNPPVPFHFNCSRNGAVLKRWFLHQILQFFLLQLFQKWNGPKEVNSWPNVPAFFPLQLFQKCYSTKGILDQILIFFYYDCFKFGALQKWWFLHQILQFFLLQLFQKWSCFEEVISSPNPPVIFITTVPEMELFWRGNFFTKSSSSFYYNCSRNGMALRRWILDQIFQFFSHNNCSRNATLQKKFLTKYSNFYYDCFKFGAVQRGDFFTKSSSSFLFHCSMWFEITWLNTPVLFLYKCSRNGTALRRWILYQMFQKWNFSNEVNSWTDSQVFFITTVPEMLLSKREEFLTKYSVFFLLQLIQKWNCPRNGTVLVRWIPS